MVVPYLPFLRQYILVLWCQERIVVNATGRSLAIVLRVRSNAWLFFWSHVCVEQATVSLLDIPAR